MLDPKLSLDSLRPNAFVERDLVKTLATESQIAHAFAVESAINLLQDLGREIFQRLGRRLVVDYAMDATVDHNRRRTTPGERRRFGGGGSA